MKKLVILVWAFLFACDNKGANTGDMNDSVSRSGQNDSTQIDGRLIGDSIQIPDTGDRRVDYDKLPASPDPSDTVKQ